MKRIRPKSVLLVLLLLTGCTVVLFSLMQDYPTQHAKIRSDQLTGEYSIGGGPWQELTEESPLPAFDGPLTFRGHLPQNMSTGTQFHFLLDHLAITVSVNDHFLYSQRMDCVANPSLRREMCGKAWFSRTIYHNYTQDDVIEIHLYNLHKAGNPNAYRDFFSSLCDGPLSSLDYELTEASRAELLLGTIVVMVAFALFGVALVSYTADFPLGVSLWKWGVVCLFSGLYLLLDAPLLSFQGPPLYFRTTLQVICTMFSALFIHLHIAECLTGWRKKCATSLTVCCQCVIIVLLLFFLIQGTPLYDVAIVWVPWQIFLSACFIIFCLLEWCNAAMPFFLLLSSLLLLTAILLDLLNIRMSPFSQGALVKAAFLLLFTLKILWLLTRVPATYKAAARAQKLEAELAESQFDAAMSQIQPHFLYNALGSIYYLCTKDPPKAQKAIGDFSEYLRMNLGSLRQKTPIPFQTELQHIRTYLALEKMSSEDELTYQFHIHTVDFSIPALSVQPLVENAVKHGIFKKPGGGTVTISSEEYADHFEITVEDDGVGFDPNQPPQSERIHIGIQNVRQRLAAMCDGQLEIRSHPGSGTTATIILPKGGQKHEDPGC